MGIGNLIADIKSHPLPAIGVAAGVVAAAVAVAALRGRMGGSAAPAQILTAPSTSDTGTTATPGANNAAFPPWLLSSIPPWLSGVPATGAASGSLGGDPTASTPAGTAPATSSPSQPAATGTVQAAPLPPPASNVTNPFVTATVYNPTSPTGYTVLNAISGTTIEGTPGVSQVPSQFYGAGSSTPAGGIVVSGRTLATGDAGGPVVAPIGSGPIILAGKQTAGLGRGITSILHLRGA